MKPEKVAALKERLRTDTVFYAEKVLKIVDAGGDLVPLKPKPVQREFDEKLEAQRQAGRPMRAIVLKARKEGISTWVQAKLIQRVTQRQNHKASVVAHDLDTAGTLFEMGETMWANLPEDDVLRLKPPIRNQLHQRALYFGEPGRQARAEGRVGINSAFTVDTAKEIQGGRGFTYHSLHCSEVALWPDAKRKMTALLNAVPDAPETLVVLESTANGHNFFKELWDAAVRGENAYVPVFFAWFHEPAYSRPFLSESERQEFERSLQPDERELIEAHGVTLAQLNWRRHKIQAPEIAGDIKTFQQEYPSTPEEAFIATGKQVFSQVLVRDLLRQTEQTDPPSPSPDNPGPEVGKLVAKATVKRRVMGGTIDVPTLAHFKRGNGDWRVWKQPEEEGQYVLFCDPASGEENERGELAWHAIQVIDHRTLEQVAEYHARTDPDLLADQILLAALHYNRAWAAVERTGGYGLSINRKLWRDYHYPFLYRQRPVESSKERQEDRLGWDTTRPSKVLLEDGAKELLREGTHGIKSRLLAMEMTTYVRDPRGRTGPQEGYFSDLLIAWMGAQQIAREKPLRSKKKPTTTSTHRMLNPVAGY